MIWMNRLFVIVLALISFFTIKLYAEEKKPISIYYSSDYKSEKDNKKIGLSLSNDFDQIYKYIVTEKKEIYVLGNYKQNKNISLIKYEQTVQGKKFIVSEYPFGGENDLRIDSVNYIVVDMPGKIDKHDLFIMIIFKHESTGMKAYLSSTNISLYQEKSNGQFMFLNHEEINENNIVSPGDINSGDVYYAHASSLLPEDQGKELPAFEKINKLMICDINQDGYDDILIWSKINLSRLMKDKDKEDFLFDSEKIYVMYFDPEKKTYVKMMTFDWD